MKYKINYPTKVFITSFLVGISVFSTKISVAEETVTLKLAEGSHLWLKGDSTLHPFSSTATAMEVSAIFQTAKEAKAGRNIESFQVSIPVNSLKSGEKKLDKNMYKALKADEFPTILFTLSDKNLTSPSNGKLSIAGKENPVQIEATFEYLAEGIHIVGDKHLLMTDYGVKPPTMMGVIKVKNDVVIHFDLLLK